MKTAYYVASCAILVSVFGFAQSTRVLPIAGIGSLCPQS
jgi:hypothetical protein